MRFYKPNKGASLPTLTKPAGPADIVLDKEAVNGSGQKLVGKLDIAQAFIVNGNVEIPLETFDRTDGIRGLKIIGSLGDATASDIVKGKTASTDNGKITGTLEVSGGEHSYTMQIKTQYAIADTDYIMYYAPGSSEKTMLSLTESFQTFTSGDFICLNRRRNGNITSNISFSDSNGNLLLNSGSSTNPKYIVNPNTIGWSTINIGAIKRDFPSMAQIVVKYMD